MSIQFLKRSLTCVFLLSVACYVFFGSAASARTGAVPASRTGAPMFGTIPAEPTCTACHTTNLTLNLPGGTLNITLPATYTPGQDVPVTVSMTRADLVKFGFQVTALTEQGQKAGEFVLTDTARTQLQTGTAGGAYDGRQYVAHTAAGTTTTTPGQISWGFTWKAPATAVGRVTFYVAGNATNNASNNAGDFIYNTSKGINAAGFTPGTAAIVSAASFTAGSSPDAWVALFGSGLSATTVTATQATLPTQLGEVRVVVKDSANVERDAQLLFISPGQINFLVPTATAAGNATVTVLRTDAPVATGTLNIAAVNPSLFTFNATGAGLPAGVAVRVKGGVQTTDPIAHVMTGQWMATPIDLGAADEQVFLSLFGTGFRGRTGTSGVTATIGGEAATVSFAGAQGSLVGVDQVNILIPRSLIGRGNVNVMLVVDGKTANTVTVNVK